VRIPLFPLDTVLMPGAVLPLHIFEKRYRMLMADLLSSAEPAEFGVVGIEAGVQVGAGGVRSMAAVGTVARVTEAGRRSDGRFDLVTVGTWRFRLRTVDTSSRPYLMGDVSRLGEDVGDGSAADAMATTVDGHTRTYLDLLAELRRVEGPDPRLPRDPTALSYRVADAIVAERRTKQDLLEAPTSLARLMAADALLRREIALIRAMATVPAPDLLLTRISPQ
jgi:hypothetical protein